MSQTVYDSLKTNLLSKSRRVYEITKHAHEISLKVGEISGTWFPDSLPSESAATDDHSFQIQLERVLHVVSVLAPKHIGVDSNGFFECVLEGAFGVEGSLGPHVRSLRLVALTSFYERWRDPFFRAYVWGKSAFKGFVDGPDLFNLRGLIDTFLDTLGTNVRPLPTVLIELFCCSLHLQLGIMSLRNGIPFLMLFGPCDAPRVYIFKREGPCPKYLLFGDRPDSEFFQRLETLCDHSSYNLPKCASTNWMHGVNAHLSSLVNVWQPNSKPFQRACASKSKDYLVLAMKATGLITVNVEGKGDCFYLAFWYGFSGGEVADFDKCLELRRLVAKVFLSKCQSDADIVSVLRNSGSFGEMNSGSDAQFMRLLFTSSETSLVTLILIMFLSVRFNFFRKHSP